MVYRYFRVLASSRGAAAAFWEKPGHSDDGYTNPQASNRDFSVDKREAVSYEGGTQIASKKCANATVIE